MNRTTTNYSLGSGLETPPTSRFLYPSRPSALILTMADLTAASREVVSGMSISIWKRRALASEPLSGNDLLLQPLRDFFGRKDEELGHREMRTALIAAVTTDRVTTIEKVTEVVKLTPSQQEALGEDLSSAFDAGDAVLVQKVTTTKTESPDPTAVINAYQILFPKDEDRVSGTVGK